MTFGANFQLTRKFTLLVKVLLGVFTFTGPVVAPLGMVVVISVLEATLKLAALPLKVTLVVPVKLFPRIMTAAPNSPEAGSVRTKGPNPSTGS
jgi:hypothetical protein